MTESESKKRQGSLEESVCEAVQNMSDTKGSSAKSILHFLRSQGGDEAPTPGELKAALKSAVDRQALQRTDDGLYLTAKCGCGGGRKRRKSRRGRSRRSRCKSRRRGSRRRFRRSRSHRRKSKGRRCGKSRRRSRRRVRKSRRRRGCRRPCTRMWKPSRRRGGRKGKKCPDDTTDSANQNHD